MPFILVYITKGLQVMLAQEYLDLPCYMPFILVYIPKGLQVMPPSGILGPCLLYTLDSS